MRKLAVALIIIGVVAGLIYVRSGTLETGVSVRNRLIFASLLTTCMILSVIEFAIKGKFRSRTQAVIVIVTVLTWSIYIVATIYGLA